MLIFSQTLKKNKFLNKKNLTLKKTIILVFLALLVSTPAAFSETAQRAETNSNTLIYLIVLGIGIIMGVLIRPFIQKKLWFLFDTGHKIFGVKSHLAAQALIKITNFNVVLKLKTGHTRQYVCSNGITFNVLEEEEKNESTNENLDGTGLSIISPDPKESVEDASDLLEAYGFECKIKESLEKNEGGKIYFLHSNAFKWPLIFRLHVMKMPTPTKFN